MKAFSEEVIVPLPYTSRLTAEGEVALSRLSELSAYAACLLFAEQSPAGRLLTVGEHTYGSAYASTGDALHDFITDPDRGGIPPDRVGKIERQSPNLLNTPLQIAALTLWHQAEYGAGAEGPPVRLVCFGFHARRTGLHARALGLPASTELVETIIARHEGELLDERVREDVELISSSLALRRQERAARLLALVDGGGGSALTSISQRTGPRYQDLIDSRIVSTWASQVLAARPAAIAGPAPI